MICLADSLNLWYAFISICIIHRVFFIARRHNYNFDECISEARFYNHRIILICISGFQSPFVKNIYYRLTIIELQGKKFNLVKSNIDLFLNSNKFT